MKNKQPLVSIIIPTYNSEKTLDKCLKSIKNQTYKNIEIVIIDNLSSDKTKKIAEKHDTKICLLKSERSKAKNFGTEKTRGKYVCFVDSDMELTPGVIKNCLKAINTDKKVGGVIIPERSLGKSFWVKVRDFERSFYFNTDIESARFFRKDLFNKVHGFDEDVVFLEEATLPQKIEKLGFDVKTRTKSMIFHHEDNFSLWKWLKKKYYYGKTGWVYKERYKAYTSKQTSPVYRFILFLKNKRFYSNPILGLGVLFLKSLEYFSIELGYLTGNVKRV